MQASSNEDKKATNEQSSFTLSYETFSSREQVQRSF